LRLVDTAGLRESNDPVERIGVEISESYLTRAAIVLACAENAATFAHVRAAIEGRTTGAVIVVRTKSDLAPPTAEELSAYREALGASAAIPVSAETGAGIGALVDAVSRTVTE